MMIAVVFVLFFGLVAAWLIAPSTSERTTPAQTYVPAPSFVLGDSRV